MNIKKFLIFNASISLILCLGNRTNNYEDNNYFENDYSIKMCYASFDDDNKKINDYVLSYTDIFKKYYDLTSQKLKDKNIDFSCDFEQFCENYYSSNMNIFDYFYSYIQKEAKEDCTILQGPLKASNSSDEDYILNGINISSPKIDNYKNNNFDPDITPLGAIRRTIYYSSSSAYEKINKGDILCETSTKFNNMGHTALIYDCGKKAEGKIYGSSTYIQTIEAVGGGVQFGFLDDDRMVKFGIVIVRPNNAYSSDISDACIFAKKQLGKPYYYGINGGYYQTSIDSEHWYCSELVYAAYYNTSIIIAYPSSSGYLQPFNILFSSRVNFVSFNNTLDIEYLGKINGKYKVRIYNRTGSTATVYYNTKKCFISDAKKWKNLKDYSNTKFTLSNNNYADVSISPNWFADTFAICHIRNRKRYISYADNIDDNTLRMSVYKNVINA